MATFIEMYNSLTKSSYSGGNNFSGLVGSSGYQMPFNIFQNYNVQPFMFNNLSPFLNFNFGRTSGSAQPSKPSQASNVDTTKVNKKGIFLKGKGKNSEYGPKFLARVKEIANKLKCDYRDLLAMMCSESGINAKTIGKNGASGLICWMPTYYNVAKIRKMSPMEQLDLVEETILKAKNTYGFKDKVLAKEDLYALIFLPARASRDVLCQKGEGNRFYEANAGLDANRDGKITKKEMAVRIDKKYVSDESFLA